MRWGEHRFGRLAPFLREDTGPTYGNAYITASSRPSETVTSETLYVDAVAY